MPIGDGRKVVAAAGTREQLSTSSVGIRSASTSPRCRRTRASWSSAARRSSPRPARAAVWRWRRGRRTSYDAEQDQVDDLNQVWLDAVTSGEGVSYAYTYEA
jgi:hypothetical protein